MRRQPGRSGGAEARSILDRISLSQVWAAVAILVPLLVVTSTPLVAIDLAYQIRAGELMLDQGSLLRVDTFTVTAAGLEWTNQQWLAQILIALTFRAGGWLALALLRGALAGLILWFVYASCRARGAPRRTAAWLTLAAGVLLPPGFQLRPQIFGMACFAAVVWLLSRRDAHPSGIFAIPLVALAWANLHGSFFLAPVLLSIAWIDERSRMGPRTRALAILVPLSLLATMVNPFGAGVWTYAVGLSMDPVIRRVVEEWQPPTIRSYAGAVFFLSATGVAVLLSRVRRSISPATTITLVLFFAAGLFTIRGIYWWAVAAPVAVVPLLATPSPRPRSDPVNRLNVAVIGFAALAVLVALFPWLSHADRGHPGERLLAFAPPGITDALDEVLEPGDVIYNAQTWGSWIEFRFPENPVTTDSRFEVVPEDAWHENELVASAVEGWQEILDDWEVDVAALSRDQQGELIRRIRRDPAWRVVYEDEDGVVLVRR